MSYMCTLRIKSKQKSYRKVRLDMVWGKCGHLVAPLLHLDTLPVLAGGLTLLLAASQLQHGRVWGSFIALKMIFGNGPLMFSKNVGELASLRDSYHIKPGIS